MVKIANLGCGFTRKEKLDYGYSRHHHWFYESKVCPNYFIDRFEDNAITLWYKEPGVEIEIDKFDTPWSDEDTNERLQQMNRTMMAHYRSAFGNALRNRMDALPHEISELADIKAKHLRNVEKIEGYTNDFELCFNKFGYVFDADSYQTFKNEVRVAEGNYVKLSIRQKADIMDKAIRAVGYETRLGCSWREEDAIPVESLLTPNAFDNTLICESKREELKYAIAEYDEMRKKMVDKIATILEIKNYKYEC